MATALRAYVLVVVGVSVWVIPSQWHYRKHRDGKATVFFKVPSSQTRGNPAAGTARAFVIPQICGNLEANRNPLVRHLLQEMYRRVRGCNVVGRGMVSRHSGLTCHCCCHGPSRCCR